MTNTNSSSDFESHSPRRRDFIKVAAVASAVYAAASTPPDLAIAAGSAGSGEMPMRPFGRHADVKLSALGMGGHHLGEYKSVDEAAAAVHEAIDAGITFFDNCWEYYNGRTENWLGRALKGRRDRVFLMTKVCTHGRGADLAMQMLEDSLRRLQTDHLDLWQIHGVTFDNDPELIYAKGSVLEAFEKAKKAGKVRFVGFTGHKDPLIHLRTIQMGYPFDSVQMPLNPFDGTFQSFEKIVLPEAHRRGIAVLGMKSMGGTAEMVKKGMLKLEEALRYAMSLPVAVTISGMNSLEVLRKNLAVAHGFTPMTAKAMDDLRERCADAAADGHFETYKTSIRYDNPQAREPHGFPLDPQVKEVKDMFQNNLGEVPH